MGTINFTIKLKDSSLKMLSPKQIFQGPACALTQFSSQQLNEKPNYLEVLTSKGKEVCGKIVKRKIKEEIYERRGNGHDVS